MTKCIYVATQENIDKGYNDVQIAGHCDNMYSHNCNSKCPGTCKDKQEPRRKAERSL